MKNESTVLRCAELPPGAAAKLLARFGLQLQVLPLGGEIPGSHWGESEAGLIGEQVFVRPDTPVHSLLHEACHSICMDDERRQGLHTDAGGDDLEENAVCYLQILLADALPGFGRARALADMDAWGYSFRLGSAKAWFEQDADDAQQWLQQHQLVGRHNRPTWQRR